MPSYLKLYCDVASSPEFIKHGCGGRGKFLLGFSSLSDQGVDSAHDRLQYSREIMPMFARSGADSFIQYRPFPSSFCSTQIVPPVPCPDGHGCEDLGQAQCEDSQCVCNPETCFVGGKCVPKKCEPTAAQLDEKLKELSRKVEDQRSASVDVSDPSNLADSESPEVAREIKDEVAEMGNLVKESSKNDLKDLLNKQEEVASTATTSVEYQPSVPALIREMGPERLEAAVEEVTRGVSAIMNATNDLPAGAISQMTTTDAKMFNQVGDALDMAEASTVGLRKILKAIRGNACILNGDEECWAEAQMKEPWEESVETVQPESLPQELEQRAAPPCDLTAALAYMFDRRRGLGFASRNSRQVSRKQCYLHRRRRVGNDNFSKFL